MARAWNQMIWKILSDPCCSLNLWNTGPAEVMDFAVLTWTKWVAQFLIFPRAHTKILEEKFFIQLGVASLWALCVSPWFLWVSVEMCVDVWERWGELALRKPRSTHMVPHLLHDQYHSVRAGGLSVCKPQLMCSNLETITSPGPSAVTGAVVAASQASPCCSTLPVMNCAFHRMPDRLVWIFILLQAGISDTWSSCIRCNFTRLNWEFRLLLYIQ